MRIAVFTDSFLPGAGGTEHAVYNLCKSLIESGNEIILFAPDYHREQKFDLFKVYRVKSIKLTHNDMAVLLCGELGWIYKKAREFAPDLVYYCSASGMSKCAIKVAKKLGVPVVATIHTKFKDAFFNATHSHLITFCIIKTLVSRLNKSDAVTTVSRDMKRELANYGYRGDVQVIKNGVRNVAKSERLLNRTIDGKAKFLYCGHLVKIKNIQFTLKSLAYLKEVLHFDNFEFSIVGRGNYRKKLEKMTKKLGLKDNVEFVGFVGDKTRLNEIYSQEHLLLFPSLFDNDSLVILEAASNGVPALTLSGCGSSERITDGQNGFVVRYDSKDFAEKILNVVTDGELYSKVCGNLHTLTANSWDEIAQEYVAFFESVIKAA